MSEEVHRDHREITESTEINLLIRDFIARGAKIAKDAKKSDFYC